MTIRNLKHFRVSIHYSEVITVFKMMRITIPANNLKRILHIKIIFFLNLNQKLRHFINRHSQTKAKEKYCFSADRCLLKPIFRNHGCFCCRFRKRFWRHILVKRLYNICLIKFQVKEVHINITVKLSQNISFQIVAKRNRLDLIAKIVIYRFRILV